MRGSFVCELGAQTFPFYPQGFQGRIEFIPIGPNPEEKRRIMSSDLQRLGSNSKVQPEANELSLVIVLWAKTSEGTLTALLGADASTEGVERALGYWNRYASERGLAGEFDAIKIPHHGSIKSHAASLCQMRRSGQGEQTGAVSSGTRPALPDREVLREYLQSGWSVMTTSTRVHRVAPSLPMTLADRPVSKGVDVVRHTIRLSWRPTGGLTGEPAAAKIGLSDLNRYETATT